MQADRLENIITKQAFRQGEREREREREREDGRQK